MKRALKRRTIAPYNGSFTLAWLPQGWTVFSGGNGAAEVRGPAGERVRVEMGDVIDSTETTFAVLRRGDESAREG